MLLAIDVGNTQTHVGLFAQRELVGGWRFATEREKTGDELAVMIQGLLGLDGFSRESVTGCVVASGVPRLNFEYADTAQRRFGVRALVVDSNVDTGMPILTTDPRSVGADLIVQAVAARELYGAPCIVVGFGTATTFSAISASGEYLGHAIAPGIEVSMDALATRAARLMKIELADPGTVVGKNTVESLQAGAVYGFAGQVDGIVQRMRTELGAQAVSVATGGLASLIFEHATSLDKLDQELTLRGLQLVYEHSRR